jgi:hypothetical protein
MLESPVTEVGRASVAICVGILEERNVFFVDKYLLMTRLPRLASTYHAIFRFSELGIHLPDEDKDSFLKVMRWLELPKDKLVDRGLEIGLGYWIDLFKYSAYSKERGLLNIAYKGVKAVTETFATACDCHAGWKQAQKSLIRYIFCQQYLALLDQDAYNTQVDTLDGALPLMVRDFYFAQDILFTRRMMSRFSDQIEGTGRATEDFQFATQNMKDFLEIFRPGAEQQR